MYCFDTSVLIDIFNGREQIKKKLEEVSHHILCINPITLCELYKGAAHSAATPRRLAFLESLQEQTEFLEFTELACQIYGDDYLKLKRAGTMVKDPDLMIAAICKAHNKILIMTDKRDFNRIPGLQLEVW